VPKAVNKVGLRRAGFDGAARKRIEAAVRTLLDRSLTMDEVIARIRADNGEDTAVQQLLGFLESSERGVARG
jgi:UDP-N-acetylglucosamine acyltransferase